MNKFVSVLQKILMPIANKMNTNRYVKAIRDGFVVSVPYTMVGSLLTSLLSIPGLEKVLGENGLAAIKGFVGPANQMTNSIISVFVIFGIAFALAKSYKLNVLHGSLTAFVMFLIICPSIINAEGGLSIANALDLGYFGPRAIFTAMVMAVLGVEVYRWSIEHKLTINLPASVPASIQDSFTSFIPAGIAIIVSLLIRQGFLFTAQGNMTDFIFYWIQSPLTGVALSFPSMILQGVLINLFWFFGLHGQTIVGSVFRPFLTASGTENLNALAAGNPLPHVFSGTFQHVWTSFGFWIAVPLLIALFMYRKKRKDWAAVMKISAIPGIFNIYEPLMFGMPLVLNPFMFIPLIVTPIVTTSVGYLSILLGLTGIPTGISMPITTPIFINGILGTNTLMAGVIQIIMVVPLAMMWYFFLSIQDKSEREEGIYVEEA